MRSCFPLLPAVSAWLLSACGGDPSAPREERVVLEVHGDTVVFAAPGASTTVQVVARAADTGEPEKSVNVTWRVASGAGTVSAGSATGADGAAVARVNAAQPGTVVVTAAAPSLVGPAPRIPVHFVAAPGITAVAGNTVQAGAEAVIMGTGFSAVPAHNIVTFAGIRGTVLQAGATELRVRVPGCLPTRDVEVRVALGTLAGSNGLTVPARAVSGTALSLQPGRVAQLASADALNCVRLASDGGAAYLVTIHNVDARHGPDVALHVRALGASVPGVQVGSGAAASQDAAQVWEARLRMREQQLRSATDAVDMLQAPTVQVPVVGERRTFNVLNRDNGFDRVTAEVRRVSPRAVLWVDVAAATSLTATDLQGFADVFEDPIHDGMVQVFGSPSDIDGDQRVGILFTPAVNRLTAPGSSSFIAGYFYGCDLVSRARCDGTNSGELLYSMVPDPTGAWGDPRSRASVLAAVPPVLAHEFQHMISFARRGFSSDVLWLSEGLAHAAEDVVADMLDQRGDASGANGFRAGNRNRASRYLRSTRTVRLLSPEQPGTLEQRGAAWLLLKYLQAHHGGYTLLRTLTGSSKTGVSSVAAATGRPWQDLWSDFGVALWADGAPGLSASPEPRFGFGGYAVRDDLADPVYGLNPVSVPWRDFNQSFALGSGGHAHLIVTASPADPPLNLVVTDPAGGDPGPSVRASVLRIR